MLRPLPFALMAFAACSDTTTSRSSASGALLPDTQTVAGVLEMRHAADAFARAPQWRLDTVPIVIIDGGETFDLSGTVIATLLQDGRSVVVDRYGGSGMMLFDAAGRPERLLARNGQGPGELAGPEEPLLLPGDTLLVIDESNGVLNRYTADSGLVRSERRERQFSLGCHVPTGRLADGRYVGSGICSHNRMAPDGSVNPLTQLVVHGADFASIDTVAMVLGSRMTVVEITQGGRTFPSMQWIQFGQPTSVTAIDSTIVVGSGDGGYALDLRRADGTPTGRIVVERPPRMLHDSERRAWMEGETLRMMSSGERRVDRVTAERQAASRPIADTIAAYRRVMASPAGTLWVLDYALPGDSTWSATAFGRHGVIAGRLTSRNTSGLPVWFGDDKVMIREVDNDGLVRYGVYGIVIQ